MDLMGLMELKDPKDQKERLEQLYVYIVVAWKYRCFERISVYCVHFCVGSSIPGVYTCLGTKR